MNSSPIAVVIMSINSEPYINEALASIAEQDVKAEIVIVNSGRQLTNAQVKQFEEQGRVVQVKEPLLPGGARNLGIRHTSAPFICFLAADCLATSGWLSRRLEAHASGIQLVSSALRPAPHRRGRISYASWASYWTMHPRRRPEAKPSECLRFGLSYSRNVFEQIGLFREDLRVGEDTQLNAQASDFFGIPYWSPDIITLHRYPTTITGALIDQFKRSRRLTQYSLKEGAKIGRDLSWHVERQERSLARLMKMLEGDALAERHKGARRLLPLLSRARALGGWIAANQKNISPPR